MDRVWFLCRLFGSLGRPYVVVVWLVTNRLACLANIPVLACCYAGWAVVCLGSAQPVESLVRCTTLGTMRWESHFVYKLVPSG